MNINTGNSIQNNPKIKYNFSENKPYGVWCDARDTDYNIYASNIDLYGSINYIPSVPLTITGMKKIGDSPIVYKYQENKTTDSIGHLLLSNMEWDSYQIELKSSYTDYSIIMTKPSMPMGLLPDETKEVILYLKHN